MTQQAVAGTFTSDDIASARNDPRGECSCGYTPLGANTYVRPVTDPLCPVHTDRPPREKAGASDFQKREGIRRLFGIAETSVNKTWGSPRELLGPVLYRALVAEELLRIVAAQDGDTDAEIVRWLADGLWDLLTERHPCS